jgi:hypothetical protein
MEVENRRIDNILAKMKNTKRQTLMDGKLHNKLNNDSNPTKGRVWRYQLVNQNPYTEEEQTTQWSKENKQKDKQRSTKHTYKTKDRVSLWCAVHFNYTTDTACGAATAYSFRSIWVHPVLSSFIFFWRQKGIDVFVNTNSHIDIYIYQLNLLELLFMYIDWNVL